MTKTFDEVVKEHHEVLKTTNKCYILNCGNIPEIILRGKQSGNIHYYCRECSFNLINTGLFEQVR
jgi:hypothetical protein